MIRCDLPTSIQLSIGTHLSEEIGKLLGVVHLPDALSSPSFRGLHHDGEADLVGCSQTLVHRQHTPVLVDLMWHTHSVAL